VTIEQAERAALRGVAHLLPAKWRQIVDLIAAPIPATPERTAPAPADEAANRLDAVDHIVVVMLENRSFDHMLGYLSLPSDQGGRARGDIDGLSGPSTNFNMLDDQRYAIRHLDRTQFSGEAEDPDHAGRSVDEQLAGGGAGFVANFARISGQRALQLNRPAPDPGLVMGYYDADDLPVYDHLAADYCVVDRWFSSVPGATWPNRLYALAGQAAGSRDDASPPIYELPSFVRYLDRSNVSWRWYSFDPATLRAADPAYRLSNHDHFAFVDARKVSVEERAAGELTEEGSFLDHVAAGDLASVSWIDPHFKDLRVLGPDSNDDHPPGDVLAGQDLILTIYHALSSSPLWPKTLLVITYDEHGGFYDHVQPPDAVGDEPEFRHLGVRVPALLVSPLVARGSSSTTLLGPDFHFDHTSIIKTILTRFCKSGGQIPELTPRVAAANHLGHLLAGGPPRDSIGDHAALADQLVSWRSRFVRARFQDPIAVGGNPRRLTDFQTGFYEMARLLRQAGLPGGHP
jgi:phospholipase C